MLFLGNGLNIGWSARFEFQKKTPYLEEMKQCWFTIQILFRSYVDLRLCLLVIPKTWNYFGFRPTFPARLVLWQYSMHVFVTYLWKHRSPFRCKLLRALVSICLSNLFSWIGICSAHYTSYPLGEEISGSLRGPFLLHWVLSFIIILKGKLKRFGFVHENWNFQCNWQFS
jgi:hypothetical protein